MSLPLKQDVFVSGKHEIKSVYLQFLQLWQRDGIRDSLQSSSTEIKWKPLDVIWARLLFLRTSTWILSIAPTLKRNSLFLALLRAPHEDQVVSLCTQTVNGQSACFSLASHSISYASSLPLSKGIIYIYIKYNTLMAMLTLSWAEVVLKTRDNKVTNLS